jgi:hypothetical protein
MSYGTQGLGQVANMGSFAYLGTQGAVNSIFTAPALAADALGGPFGGPLKALNGLAAMLQTLGGTPGGSAITQFMMAMLGLKGKAEGGKVGGATPYMVGEKGPELFIPKTDGVIIPNDLGPMRHEGGGVSAKGHTHSWGGKSSMDKSKIKDILSKAGFTGQALDDAVQIAQGESGYNPYAANFNKGTGDESYGLMQINMLGDLGPGRRKWFGIKKNEDLYDAQTNANAAYKIFKAKGYRFDKDWVTQSQKLASKGVYDGSGGTSTDSSGIQGVSVSAEDSKLIKNSFIATYGDKKGAELFKAFEEFNKTGKLPTSNTVSSLLGMNSADAAAMSAALGVGGGSTVNYGGVTFNITTPADNKSFVDSVKKALKDLNFLGIGKS